MAQVWYGRVADCRSSRSFALTLRLGVLVRNCKPIAVHSVDPLGVDPPPFPTQQHMDTTIASARGGGGLSDAFDQMSLPGST